MPSPLRALAIGVVLAMTLLAATSPLVSSVLLAVTIAVMAVLMLRARTREPLLQPARTWMLLAVAVGLVATVTGSVEQLVRDGRTYPGIADGIAALYLPLVLRALMSVPLEGRRPGFRARAAADGLIASTSLMYLLEPALHGLSERGRGVLADGFAVGYALGEVFLVGVALAVLVRCEAGARPFVRWMASGVAAMSAADLTFALTDGEAVALRGAVLQLGIFALVGMSRTRVAAPRDVVPLDEVDRALALVPLLPFAAAVMVSMSLVVAGKGLDPGRLLMAVLVAVALVLRQLAGARDRRHLLHELAQEKDRLVRELRVDRLTGAANRLALEEAAAELLEDGRSFSLVVLDLDDFKLVNDNHGHAVGDEVLRDVAHRLVAAVRAEDLVARLGGDEFALLLPGGAMAREVVSQRVLDVLVEPVQVGERRFHLSASLGLVSRQDTDSVERLLADADGAMYEAKRDKTRSSVVSLDRTGRETVAWRSQVREQVGRPDLSQFAVHYQPLVDLRSGRIRGMEALLRWEHPSVGAVPPDVFIPLAEQCGSVAVLGDFVLRVALEDIARFSLAVGRPLAVGVNVSPRQLTTSAFADEAARLLLAHRLAPSQLTVEITERGFEEDLDSVTEQVRRLSGLGVHLAVDDFGTGYSSLRYLQTLDLDSLKVDKGFVQGAADGTREHRLIEGIVGLARGIGLEVVAEGVETLAQLELVREAGCDVGQGYYFSRPVDADAMLGLLLDAAHRESFPAPRPAGDDLAHADGRTKPVS